MLVGFEIVVEYMYRAREVGDLGEYSDLVGGIQLVRIYYRPSSCFKRLVAHECGASPHYTIFGILKHKLFLLLYLSGIHSFILYTLGTRCLTDLPLSPIHPKGMYLYILFIVVHLKNQIAHF